MKLICILCIGALGSAFSFAAIELSCFVMRLCNEDCKGCDKLNGCFAKKEISWLRSNYVSEWMLISYWKVRKQCQYSCYCNLTQKLICFAVSFGCYLTLFWSKGIGLQGLLYGIAAMSLFFLSIVDWNTEYIPMECNILIFACGLIQLFADFSNWLEYVIGLLTVSGFMILINCIFTPLLKRKYAKETDIEIDNAIGDGDIKLMAATGLLLGWKLNFLALAIGCIMGSIIHVVLMTIKKGDRQFALGPYLSLGVYITMMCGEQLIGWYLSLLGVTPL